MLPALLRLSPHGPGLTCLGTAVPQGVQVSLPPGAERLGYVLGALRREEESLRESSVDIKTAA